MQYRILVGSGPSLNTWPRCALHLLHCTSVLSIPWELSLIIINDNNHINSFILSFSAAKNAGQPHPFIINSLFHLPELNFVVDEKIYSPQQMQR